MQGFNESSKKYRKKKSQMKEYQRNIFGFSFKVAFWSFENMVTILLTLIFGTVVIGFMVQRIYEVENQKLDVLKSTQTIEDYKQIGAINIVKQTVLMPVVEIKIRNINNIKQFGIFHRNQTSNTQNIWDAKYQTDIDKLSRFIKIVINVSTRSQGESKYIERSFRQCQYDDFNNRGYQIDKSNISHLLCPDNQFLEDKMFIENSYESNYQRQSFEIQIVKCSHDVQSNQCADDSQIHVLTNELVFNVYFVYKKVNWKTRIDQDPFEVQFSFFQQFMVSINNYRDCNIFIRQNIVKYKKNRLLNIKQYNEKFYELKAHPNWYSNGRYMNNIMLSSDGKNYKQVETQILAGIYFFLYNEVIIHERQLFTYSMILGQLGGIMGLIISVLNFIVEPIRFNFDLAKIIQILYFKGQNKDVLQIRKLQQHDQNHDQHKAYQSCSQIKLDQLNAGQQSSQQHNRLNSLDQQNICLRQQQQEHEQKVQIVDDRQSTNQQHQFINNQRHLNSDVNDIIKQDKLDLDCIPNNLDEHSQAQFQTLFYTRQQRRKYSLSNLNKLTQLQSKKNFSNFQLLDELEFTTLDILNDILFMRPVFFIFKKTSLVRNYGAYNSLKQDLLEKLQIQKIVGQMGKQHENMKQIERLKSQIEILREIQYMDEESRMSEINMNRMDEFNMNRMSEINMNRMDEFNMKRMDEFNMNRMDELGAMTMTDPQNCTKNDDLHNIPYMSQQRWAVDQLCRKQGSK